MSIAPNVHFCLMICPIWPRIARSETYRLFKSEGLKRAGLHLWALLRDHWRSLLFIRVEGYIAEADLREFRFSEQHRQNIAAEMMEFHLMKQGEALPDFCYGITPQEMERRLATGHLCCVLRREGNIVCAAWIGFGRINYGGDSIYLYSDHHFFTLKSDQAWLYDEICSPDYRNKGLSSGLKNELLQHLKNSGIIFVLATVGLDNIANIKALLRTEFRLKEKVFFRRYLLFKIRERQILSEADNREIMRRYHI